jgi:hypothetical protein
MKLFPIAFLLPLLLTTCKPAGRKTTEEPADSTATVRQKIDKDSGTIPEPPVLKDTSVLVSFDSSRQQSAYSRLGRTGPSITYHFSIKKPENIIARIIPDKAGCNVRFNQIVMPGNKTDGPFGLELNYKLPRKGSYKLIVGHNMMAGDPEVCDFRIEISLQSTVNSPKSASQN